jgi:hypothetical protein
MRFGNMRQLGVAQLVASCLNDALKEQAPQQSLVGKVFR